MSAGLAPKTPSRRRSLVWWPGVASHTQDVTCGSSSTPGRPAASQAPKDRSCSALPEHDLLPGAACVITAGFEQRFAFRGEIVERDDQVAPLLTCLPSSVQVELGR